MISCGRWLSIALAALMLVACGGGRGERQDQRDAPLVLLHDALPAMDSLHRVDADVLAAGQPSAAELAAFAQAGVTTVIDLRGADEDRGFDELGTALELGMDYVAIPISGPDSMDPHAVAAFNDAINRARGPVLVHCRSGSRVGAMVALRARQQGVGVEESMNAGIAAGMGSGLQPAIRERLEQVHER